jgi:hypothetical protein
VNQKEFESRAGIRITAEEYARVEQGYMGLPDSVDEDKFCKIWLKEGGIQSVLDERMAESFRHRETIGKLENEIESKRSAVRYWNERAASFEEEAKALKVVIETIKGVVAV